MSNFIFATGAKNPFNDKVSQRRFYVVEIEIVGIKTPNFAAIKLHSF